MNIQSAKTSHTILQNKKQAENQLLNKKKNLYNEGFSSNNKNTMKINHHIINDNSLSEEIQFNDMNLYNKSNAYTSLNKNTKHKSSRDAIGGQEFCNSSNTILPLTDIAKDIEETSESKYNIRGKINNNPLFRIQKNKEINIRPPKKSNTIGSKNINIQNFIDKDVAQPSNNNSRQKLHGFEMDHNTDQEFGRRTFNVNNIEMNPRGQSNKTNGERYDRFNKNAFNQKKRTNFKKDQKKSEDNDFQNYRDFISDELNDMKKNTQTMISKNDELNKGALAGNKFKMSIPKSHNPKILSSSENKLGMDSNYGYQTATNQYQKTTVNTGILSINNNKVNTVPKNNDEISNENDERKQVDDLRNKYNTFYGNNHTSNSHNSRQREVKMKNFIKETNGFDNYKTSLKSDPSLDSDFLFKQFESKRYGVKSKEQQIELDQDELQKPKFTTKIRKYEKPWLANTQTSSTKEISKNHQAILDSRIKYMNTDQETSKPHACYLKLLHQ